MWHEKDMYVYINCHMYKLHRLQKGTNAKIDTLKMIYESMTRYSMRMFEQLFRVTLVNDSSPEVQRLESSCPLRWENDLLRFITQAWSSFKQPGVAPPPLLTPAQLFILCKHRHGRSVLFFVLSFILVCIINVNMLSVSDDGAGLLGCSASYSSAP